MRLDLAGGIFAGGERGPAVAPYDVEQSRLLRAVSYSDPELSMPPRGKLSDEEIDVLRRWVERGAPAPVDREAIARESAESFDLEARLSHWAFQPVEDPELPDVAHAAWPAVELDHFVLAAVEEAGFEPAPPADRAAQLRRLSFDLIGLPPTPEELEVFLADERGDAWERQVDRLLASPHFGERWGRHWLDLVRYAETRGHEFDYPLPNAWQYRDYVVRALNADVPYDRLVREHVAGDLLAEPRPNPEGGWNEAPLGTGFWFFHEEVHSPVDTRADETDRTANKLDVLSRAFLGLTVACARCHDHKFDAISTRDYYALAGFPESSHYRQLRFETDETNRAVAEELEAQRRERRRRAAREVAASLEVELDDVERYLLATRDASHPAAVLGAPSRPGPGNDLLLWDFEDGTWDGWTVSGTAFGASPVVAAEQPDYQGDLGQRGERLALSFHTRNGEDVSAADGHTGELLSDPFELERDRLHFLIGGGPHPGETCVQVLVDGEVVAEAVGPEANRTRHHELDLSQWRGRTARLRVRDTASGSWGQISIDHVVLSDRGGAGVLDVELRPGELAAREHRVASAAHAWGLDAERLAAWYDEVLAARADRGHPLHLWSATACDGSPDGPLTKSWLRARAKAGSRLARDTDRLRGVRVVVDFGTDNWIQDGSAFRRGRRGEPILGRGGRLLDGIRTIGAAVADPLWAELELAPGVEREPGELTWEQPGRTLHSPQFEVESGELWYLVRGRGNVFAGIDSHRMVAGPLHGVVLLEFDTRGEWRWVRHDLTDYVGHVAHVEVTPRGALSARAGAHRRVARRAAVARRADRRRRGPDRDRRGRRAAVGAGRRRGRGGARRALPRARASARRDRELGRPGDSTTGSCACSRSRRRRRTPPGAHGSATPRRACDEARGPRRR